MPSVFCGVMVRYWVFTIDTDSLLNQRGVSGASAMSILRVSSHNVVTTMNPREMARWIKNNVGCPTAAMPANCIAVIRHERGFVIDYAVPRNSLVEEAGSGTPQKFSNAIQIPPTRRLSWLRSF